MGSIWTEENEDRTMVKVEILACEAMNKLGIVPDDALHDIQTKADFELDRVHEIEKVTNHDIISLLTNVAEHVGDASKYIHKGLTSSDVKDTAMGVMMKHSCELLIDLEKKLHEVLKRQAQTYRNTICVVRHHFFPLRYQGPSGSRLIRHPSRKDVCGRFDPIRQPKGWQRYWQW